MNNRKKEEIEDLEEFKNRDLISLREAANYLGYHPMHLYQNYKKPGWPPYMKFKSRIFYSPSELKKWIDTLEKVTP